MPPLSPYARARISLSIAYETAARSAQPAFPAPSVFEGKPCQASGASCRETAKVCLVSMTVAWGMTGISPFRRARIIEPVAIRLI